VQLFKSQYHFYILIIIVSRKL